MTDEVKFEATEFVRNMMQGEVSKLKYVTDSYGKATCEAAIFQSDMHMEDIFKQNLEMYKDVGLDVTPQINELRQEWKVLKKEYEDITDRRMC
jgi:hypothetical protein